MMKKTLYAIDTLVLDVGSTYTKVTGFSLDSEGYHWLGRAQSPTSVDNIDKGLSQALLALAKTLGTNELIASNVLSASSAAGGLRMVAMGYMPRVTAKAAKEVAMSAGARVLEVMSYDDLPAFKKEMLCEIRPDIILLAGGTDGGDKESILEDARIIVESKSQATIIIAGNINAQPEVESIMRQVGQSTVRVPNVMPNIHTLNVKPAREAIHEQFIRQIIKAKGLGKLLARLTVNKVVPTPGAVLMAAELIAKGTAVEEGCGNIIILDIGGATTDIHSVLPFLDELSIEEKGLILTNEKQAAYRTVEGNLGLRVSAKGIIETAGAQRVLSYAGLSSENELALVNYAEMLENEPKYIPTSKTERSFDRGMAITALEIALKRHAGYIAKQFDPIMGIIPGTPIGRDLRGVKTVIASGGIFAHLSEIEARSIVLEALKQPGISLLPVQPRILIDKDYLLYSIGIMSQYRPEAALKFAKKHFALSTKVEEEPV